MVALMRAGLGRSMRTNTTPVFAWAGRKHTLPSTALNSPRPSSSTGSLMVR